MSTGNAASLSDSDTRADQRASNNPMPYVAYQQDPRYSCTDRRRRLGKDRSRLYKSTARLKYCRFHEVVESSDLLASDLRPNLTCPKADRMDHQKKLRMP